MTLLGRRENQLYRRISLAFTSEVFGAQQAQPSIDTNLYVGGYQMFAARGVSPNWR